MIPFYVAVSAWWIGFCSLLFFTLIREEGGKRGKGILAAWLLLALYAAVIVQTFRLTEVKTDTVGTYPVQYLVDGRGGLFGVIVFGDRVVLDTDLEFKTRLPEGMLVTVKRDRYLPNRFIDWSKLTATPVYRYEFDRTVLPDGGKP